METAQLRLSERLVQNASAAVLKKPAAQSANSLKALEKILRSDQIQAQSSRDSQFAGGLSAPTPQMRDQQARYAPQPVQFNERGNPLGDYSLLVRQMNGSQSSNFDGFVISTLETRNSADRLADTSQDGYSMLANTFQLSDRAALRKAAKKPRLSAY